MEGNSIVRKILGLGNTAERTPAAKFDKGSRNPLPVFDRSENGDDLSADHWGMECPFGMLDGQQPNHSGLTASGDRVQCSTYAEQRVHASDRGEAPSILALHQRIRVLRAQRGTL